MTAPILFAHRGAAAELPENTLAAFRRALELGADAIETDAHLTKDGHVVLSHDETGARMAGVTTAIADATLAEIREWDVGWGFVDPSGGRPHARAGHQVATLDEALAEFPGVEFNVDAKSTSVEMPERIVRVIQRAQAESRVRLASFQSSTLRKIRRIYGGLTGLGQSEVVRLVLSPTALLRAAPLGGTAAQLPYRMYAIDLGSRRMVEKCHALRLDVHYWTVNEPKLARALLEAGADGIMTDDPRAIAPTMRAWRGKSQPQPARQNA